MQYPHRKYILYLLSKKMNAFEIRAECTAKGLLAPNDYAIDEIKEDLGSIPQCWRPTVSQGNVKFRRWLRKKGLLVLWVPDVSVQRAEAFLHKAAVRSDLEAILLAHGDVEQARRELLVKYPEALVPDEATLHRFQEIFWDLGSMTSDGVFDFLQASEGRESCQVALQGDLVKLYGQLGLQQRYDSEVFHRHIILMGMQQALRIRANPNMQGAAMAGATGIIRLAMDAVQVLKEEHGIAEGSASLRKDAAAFVARVVQGDVVPSIDELNEAEVIDADYAEAGNVHQLPIRRR